MIDLSTEPVSQTDSVAPATRLASALADLLPVEGFAPQDGTPRYLIVRVPFVLVDRPRVAGALRAAGFEAVEPAAGGRDLLALACDERCRDEDIERMTAVIRTVLGHE